MTDTKLTTVGSLILKHSMPTEKSKQNFDIHSPLDKGGMSRMVNMLIRDGGKASHEHINSLGQMFFNKATEIGASTPLSDYINESDERSAILKEYETKANKIILGTGTKSQKNDGLGSLTSDYNKRIEKQNLDYLSGRGSTAAKMARTGARGNPAQLASGTSTPLMSLNVKGELIPLVIKSSFASGMSPAEHLAMSYMGRGSTVLSQLSTALPGALFKRLSPTVFHETITVDDCGTKNGITQKVTDKKSVLGRYEAATNHLIDEEYYKHLTTSTKPNVVVRSALTCEAHEGVCKKCYGLMGSGKNPEIGENVGIIAAQSVSEVLTQAMLSTKHKATVGERRGNIYDQASNILNNPKENFKDEATISEINGKVNDIVVTPLKDYHVFVDGVKHFVPRIQQLTVKKGDDVKQGYAISTGVINPRKLVALRGLGAGRKYLAEELRNIYGGGLDPRHFELISRNLVKYVQVDSPGETGFMPGDKVTVNALAKHLQETETDTPLSHAKGMMLSRSQFELTPGTTLDANHIDELHRQGVKTVKTTNSTLRVTPVVPGLQTAKLLDKNWISRLSFSKLENSIKEAAALGHDSEVHSTDPITPFVMGNEFGDGSNGRY
jgi:DNA-directed RNA polymerase subunit beta'